MSDKNTSPTIIHTSLSPEAAYLLGLGQAIAELSKPVADGYWFNSKDQFDQRKEMMGVINGMAAHILNKIDR